jgi:hypothetical protein
VRVLLTTPAQGVRLNNIKITNLNAVFSTQAGEVVGALSLYVSMLNSSW